MAVINSISAQAEDMRTWRRHLHRHPELQFDCVETASFVADRLRDFGVEEIYEGIAKTGIVAIIDGRAPGPTIGLRADMDALPILEASGVDHASTVRGKMHACGHDGHTTMLLGAARYLAQTRNFAGRVALIFQPAEEGGGGGEVMCDEGMMERFDISRVFAIHNVPGMPVGHFFTTPGPIMAAVDDFSITLTGKGGHGAYPHDTVDPVVAALALAQGLQTIVSRNHDGRKDLVLSVTQIHAGTSHNIIPETAMLGGTVRSFLPEVQEMVKTRIKTLSQGIATAYGVSAQIEYHDGYPSTVNDAQMVDLAAAAARDVSGDGAVSTDIGPEMGAEDFAYMLERRPGAYLFLGQGEGAGLHHPAYDFNDEISPIGASFFARLVERLQPLEKAS